ncbi:sigma-E factor negative regulatory protein [Massilia horti]|uniref:Transcriptional regulator n=1 Tax=Massilia horti TaxID=2562153 RepID=A0A4Y9T5Y8_9BURK|nr:sigma-E factor negative regulatory protein [Massilia horti]TFW33318.1 transcriptional regulator [Massilia horti]
MDTNKKIREHISALGDGELSASDIELAFAALQTADGRQAWEVYHRIGDVLRAQSSPDLSSDFAARLAARLAEEPAHGKQAPLAGEAKAGVSMGSPSAP